MVSSAAYSLLVHDREVHPKAAAAFSSGYVYSAACSLVLQDREVRSYS
jgi:hypothetical protein